MRWLILLSLLCGLGSFWQTAAAEPQNTVTTWAAGVPLELAQWRKERYSDVRYTLRLLITPRAEMLTGALEIRVTLKDATAPIVLDWRATTRPDQPAGRVTDCAINGQKVEPQEINEHLIIPATAVKAGENVITLNFASPIATSGRAVTRYLDREDGAEYLYTLFVPSDASTTFPCFDQPDLKARFTLETVAPAAWRVITNTAPESTERQAIATPDKDNLTRVRFRATEPISTYLFAFAAGPWAEISEEKPDAASEKVPMRIFVRQSRLTRARQEAGEVFRLHRAALKYLTDYFAQPFPFPKYDLIIVPEFAYGGMEHAGATFLREEAILFPSEPTASDLFARAELMFHEAAHQWFGDLVTMRWFDDLWLKEGFATFMAYKAIEAILPQYNAWKSFYQRTKPLAYLTDATKGTTPIYQQIPNLSAAKSAYGNIVYRKAPSFLRQAEFYLGPDKFREAVQHFLLAHAYDNAAWSDLVHQFERASNKDLTAWAEAWVKRRGMPRVIFTLWARRNPPLPQQTPEQQEAYRKEVEKARKAHKKPPPPPIFSPTASWYGVMGAYLVRQADVLNEGGFWPMKIRLLFVNPDKKTDWMPDTIVDFELNSPGLIKVETPGRHGGSKAPLFAYANYGDYGYGLFPLDAYSREYVLAHLGEVEDDFLRAQLWGSLWDSVRDAELPPSDYLKLAYANLARETDEITIQAILNRVQTALNRYVSDADAAQFAPLWEQLLTERMTKAPTLGLRITYFRAFQNIARTDAGRATLKQILRDEMKIPGLALRSRDRFDLITTLLARGDTDAPELLKQQAERDKSDDGRRYAYAAAAAQPSAETKEKYFAAYLNDAQLAESWIEASFGPFNNARQAALTLPYLLPALKSLPQHKRNRKIFFVNGWLAAFIGGQCSAEAQTTVEKFLADEKTLDPDLRLKVLEALDGLQRCVKIRQAQK